MMPIQTDPIFPLLGKRIWVAGHRGMVGSALCRRLVREDCHVVTVTRDVVDLRRQAETEDWIAEMRPDAIFLAAATVGGVLENDRRPAEFLYDNIVLESNVIEGARKAGVAKLLLLGSSCIYPRLAPQPMAEDALLTGPLEPTNQWYAIAKIAGIKLCQSYRRQYGLDFVAAMPCNLYGPGDNFDLSSSHVIPALLRKAHEAKEARATTLEVWGTGRPRREFLYVDDCADALVHLMKHFTGETHVNVGSRDEITIDDLAHLVMRTVGYDGNLKFDTSKPDGTPRKLMDSSLLASLGWTAKTKLPTGVARTYEAFLASQTEDDQ